MPLATTLLVDPSEINVSYFCILTDPKRETCTPRYKKLITTVSSKSILNAQRTTHKNRDDFGNINFSPFNTAYL